MRTATVADAVIFTSRPELSKLASSCLKMKSVSNVMTPSGASECSEALANYTRALLVIDWDLGSEQVAQVLAANRSKAEAVGRPILLVASEVSEALIATAAEYNVTQIFTEKLSAQSLGARLGSLMISESLPNETKKSLSEAAEARQKGDLKGALTALQKVLAKNPTNFRLKSDVAETLLMLGETEKSLKILEGVDQAKPPYLRGLHLQGRALMKLGRADEAIAMFEKANLFNPNDVDRLCDLGDALLSSDRSKDAAAAFEKALSIDSSSRKAQLGRGKCQLLDGHVNDALAILREAAGDTEIASLFNTAAVLNMRRGRHEQGMSLYQQALKALGKDERIQARLYFNMGLGYRRWGKKDKAQQCFEQSTKLDPTFTKAREHMLETAASALPDKTVVNDSNQDLGGVIDFNKNLSILDDEDLEEGLYD
jgi:tetratricopeptide (TPR) repeat protein